MDVFCLDFFLFLPIGGKHILYYILGSLLVDKSRGKSLQPGIKTGKELPKSFRFIRSQPVRMYPQWQTHTPDE